MNYRAGAFLALMGFLCLQNVQGHSQMACADWDENSGQCSIYPRGGQNAPVDYKGYTNNPNAPCPLAYSAPGGTKAAGSPFTVMWPARNHATPSQDPRIVEVFLGPKDNQNANGPTLEANKLCEGPFSQCNGLNQDPDLAPCYLNCQLPTNLEAGVYTVFWKWDWRQNDGSIYATCAEFQVTAAPGSGGSGGSGSGGEPVACNNDEDCSSGVCLVDNTCLQEDSKNIPCTTNSDCPSGVCTVDNVCHQEEGLGTAGIASLVMAAFVVVAILVLVGVFFYRDTLANKMPYSVKSRTR